MQPVVEFVKESWQELKKVTWPGRKEVRNSSLVVAVVAALFMLVIYVEDMGIHWLLKLVY